MSRIGSIAEMFAGKFWAAAKVVVGSVIARVFTALGVTLTTYNGALPSLKSFLMPYFSALPPAALQLMSAVGFDIAVTMILSAYVVRLSWKVAFIPIAAMAAAGEQS